MTSQNIPPKVTIPTPMPSPRARGVHSLGTLATERNVKFSRNDDALIREASALLDMKLAAFVRWCAVEAAKKIIWETEDD